MGEERKEEATEWRQTEGMQKKNAKDFILVADIGP